jgi:hypothetical protein
MLSRLSRDSSKDYQQSIRVIGRFCTIVLFSRVALQFATGGIRSTL